MRAISIALLGQHRFASHAGDVLLLCAVAVGHGEGKPMTAHKLAGYVGMPRPTAVRRLRHLEAMRLVQRGDGGRYQLTDEGMRRVVAVGVGMDGSFQTP
ncbi:helix-turn-helix domain-containing protein [Cupriavidus taiwanensis]|uniref:helix-turn-helix domain-containing protein n=1 Tax=Cupriavidus taiwanensis TaxID=164546 RepID=UPI00254112F4|nr:helix-turn-helix domain-containing protein [Cupriavidus taiwanensis]MDK3021720.1 helix-turn-helix domain-containing protein [Cupriavidus taiwanensis]